MLKLFSTRIHEIGGVLPRHKKEKQSLSLMDIFEKLLEDDTKAPSASYLRRSFGYAQLSFFCCVNRAWQKRRLRQKSGKVWDFPYLRNHPLFYVLNRFQTRFYIFQKCFSKTLEFSALSSLIWEKPLLACKPRGLEKFLLFPKVFLFWKMTPEFKWSCKQQSNTSQFFLPIWKRFLAKKDWSLKRRWLSSLLTNMLFIIFIVPHSLFSHRSLGRLKDLVAEHLDHVHYLNDILCLRIDNLNEVLTGHLLNRLFIPLYIYSLVRSPNVSTNSLEVIISLSPIHLCICLY